MVFEDDENVNGADHSELVDDHSELVDDHSELVDDDDGNTATSDDTEEDAEWLAVMRRRDGRNSKLCPLCRRIITAIYPSDVLSECCVCGEMSCERLFCFDGHEFKLCHCVCYNCFAMIRTPNQLLQSAVVW